MKNQKPQLALGILALLSVGGMTSGCGGGAGGATQTYVYFASDRDGDWDLYEMKINGTATRALDFANSAESEIRPMISPDGRQIAYASNADGGSWPDIYVANLDGSGTPLKITDDSAPVDYPAWSPDGQYIVYARDNGTSYEIRRRNADGTGTALLVFDGTGDDTQPVYSADGAEILFVTDDGLGDKNLASVPAGTFSSTATILYAAAQDVGEPACSPDGAWIAFSLDSGAIYVMPAGGGSASLFADQAGDDFAAAWTPDSQAILWVSEETGNWEIWRRNLDGTNLANVTNGSADDGSPSAVAK
jgi:TolB protein